MEQNVQTVPLIKCVFAKTWPCLNCLAKQWNFSNSQKQLNSNKKIFLKDLSLTFLSLSLATSPHPVTYKTQDLAIPVSWVFYTFLFSCLCLYSSIYLLGWVFGAILCSTMAICILLCFSSSISPHILCMCVLSHVWLCVTPWTVALQAPLSMGFSQQEYRSGLQFSSPGNLPDPGIKSMSTLSRALAGRFFITSASGNSQYPIIPDIALSI